MRRVRSLAPLIVGLVLSTAGLFTLLQPAAGGHNGGMPRWWDPPNGKQIGDLPQFVDFPYLARVTRVVGSSLAALARSPRAPVNARVISANLSYDTELRWNANPEADIAGYEIVWRDSTQPLWEHVRRVGNVTAGTIENLNKDDNQVGVRAIDRDGNRSPVAYPIPANQ